MTISTTAPAWLPVTRAPRQPRLVCVSCDASVVNEDRARRGWQVSAYGLVRFRCAECSTVGRNPERTAA